MMNPVPEYECSSTQSLLAKPLMVGNQWKKSVQDIDGEILCGTAVEHS
jgi:hypothetical protein